MTASPLVREAVYGALFARLEAAAPFATASRRLRHWSDVTPGEQPALFQAQKSETAEQSRGQMTRFIMAVDVYVYCQAPDDLTSPSIVMNPLIDALVSALGPQTPLESQVNACTLNGLVSEVTLNGKIETDEGVLGGQAVSIIPIRIIAVG